MDIKDHQDLQNGKMTGSVTNVITQERYDVKFKKSEIPSTTNKVHVKSFSYKIGNKKLYTKEDAKIAAENYQYYKNVVDRYWVNAYRYVQDYVVGIVYNMKNVEYYEVSFDIDHLDIFENNKWIYGNEGNIRNLQCFELVYIMFPSYNEIGYIDDNKFNLTSENVYDKNPTPKYLDYIPRKNIYKWTSDTTEWSKPKYTYNSRSGGMTRFLEDEIGQYFELVFIYRGIQLITQINIENFDKIDNIRWNGDFQNDQIFVQSRRCGLDSMLLHRNLGIKNPSHVDGNTLNNRRYNLFTIPPVKSTSITNTIGISGVYPEIHKITKEIIGYDVKIHTNNNNFRERCFNLTSYDSPIITIITATQFKINDFDSQRDWVMQHKPHEIGVLKSILTKKIKMQVELNNFNTYNNLVQIEFLEEMFDYDKIIADSVSRVQREQLKMVNDSNLTDIQLEPSITQSQHDEIEPQSEQKVDEYTSDIEEEVFSSPGKKQSGKSHSREIYTQDRLDILQVNLEGFQGGYYDGKITKRKTRYFLKILTLERKLNGNYQSKSFYFNDYDSEESAYKAAVKIQQHDCFINGLVTNQIKIVPKHPYRRAQLNEYCEMTIQYQNEPHVIIKFDIELHDIVKKNKWLIGNVRSEKVVKSKALYFTKLIFDTNTSNIRFKNGDIYDYRIDNVTRV
ncbi:MAG: hypothetical protein JKX76_01300 [Colwellia sp.]|nr:hypothetical protein [Colwellia sp.]